MKKSNKLLLVALGIIFAIIAMGTIAVRLYFARVVSLMPGPVIIETERPGVNTTI